MIQHQSGADAFGFLVKGDGGTVRLLPLLTKQQPTLTLTSTYEKPSPLRTEGSQGWVEVHHPQELHEARQEVRGREHERLVLVDDRVGSHDAVPP